MGQPLAGMRPQPRWLLAELTVPCFGRGTLVEAHAGSHPSPVDPGPCSPSCSEPCPPAVFPLRTQEQ